MADRIKWYGPDKQVILQTYEGKTTWESFFNIALCSAEMLDSVDHPVQVIVDRFHAVFFVITIHQMKQVAEIVPDNQDLVIVVGAGIYVEIVSQDLGSAVAPRAFDGSYYVKTMEEAHTILRRERRIEL